MQATVSTPTLKGNFMQYFINKKNIKQSVQNLSSFFKEKGFDIPRHLLLDAFSKSIFFKNWNTLEGITSKPTIIAHIPSKKAYMIEIEGRITQQQLLTLIKDSFSDGKCSATIDNFIGEDNNYHLEISFPSTTDNFLTAMFLLASSLKSYHISRFDMLRIIFEKESLLEAVKLDFSTNNKSTTL